MEEFFNGLEGPSHPHLKRKTIDVKLVIGILIVLISTFLGIVANLISLGGIYSLKANMAYSVGYLIAPVIVNVIVSAIILIISKKNQGRNLLIFSIIALVFSFISLSSIIGGVVAERQKEKVSMDKVLSLVKDLVSHKEIIKEDISEAKYGKSAPFVEIVQDTYIEIQDLGKKNDLVVRIMNDASTFSKETLSDLNKIKEKRELLDKTSRDIEIQGNKINDLMDRFKRGLENLNVSNSMKAGIEDGLKDSVYESTETAANSLKLMDNVIKSMKKMLVFLEENQGSYIFEGEQLTFYEDDDVNSYNEIVTEYNKAIDENNKNYENVQKEIQEKIKEMEKTSD